MDSSSRILVALGISFTGLTAAIVYLLLRKDEETDIDGGIKTSRRTRIEVKVPNDIIGTVIGRGGCNVRSIQEKSGARINCNDESSNEKYRVVTIQGTPESAQLAESMIHEIIMNQPLIITHEMWVPARSCGRLIGRGGETIRSITQASCAKIIVDSAGNDERASDRRVLIKGTAEQVALAQTLIQAKVEEDSDMRHRVEVSVANRSPRREPKDHLNYLMAASNEEEGQSSSSKTERFDSAGSEGFFDVFVSALQNPGQFWVQLVSQRGVELDQLVDKMTEYYSKPENQTLHAIQEISVGQIVAAPFDHDNKYYRAEVMKIDEDEYDSAESRITLYYGDYGDSCVVKRKNIFDLRTDFLTLYFQAIECMLAHVKPPGDEWSDEATNLFEDIAQVAQWRKKLAHVVTYRESAQKKGQRAGSPVPVIELHDMEKSINIGEELVKQGLAVWDNPSLSQNGEESGSTEVNNSKAVPNSKQKNEFSPQKFENNPVVDSKLENFELNPQKTSPAPSSSSFIQKERSQNQGGGFKPKTLETTQKKESSQKKTNLTNAVFLPESFSSDEDCDGFALE